MKVTVKLRSKRGETLMETLSAILIVVVASMTLFYAIMTSARMNKITADANDSYVSEINAAEQSLGEPLPGTVTITVDVHGEEGSFQNATYDVDYIGGSGKLTSYKLRGSGDE